MSADPTHIARQKRVKDRALTSPLYLDAHDKRDGQEKGMALMLRQQGESHSVQEACVAVGSQSKRLQVGGTEANGFGYLLPLVSQELAHCHLAMVAICGSTAASREVPSSTSQWYHQFQRQYLFALWRLHHHRGYLRRSIFETHCRKTEAW